MRERKEESPRRERPPHEARGAGSGTAVCDPPLLPRLVTPTRRPLHRMTHFIFRHEKYHFSRSKLFLFILDLRILPASSSDSEPRLTCWSHYPPFPPTRSQVNKHKKYASYRSKSGRTNIHSKCKYLYILLRRLYKIVYNEEGAFKISCKVL